jgi:hypothetical protein
MALSPAFSLAPALYAGARARQIIALRELQAIAEQALGNAGRAGWRRAKAGGPFETHRFIPLVAHADTSRFDETNCFSDEVVRRRSATAVCHRTL